MQFKQNSVGVAQLLQGNAYSVLKEMRILCPQLKLGVMQRPVLRTVFLLVSIIF